MIAKKTLILILLGSCSIMALVFLVLLSVNHRPGSRRFLGLTSIKPGSIRIEGPTQAIVNTNMQVRFVINSNKQPVNAVNLDLSYDPGKLTILEVDTSESFCQFYPVNKFNNSKGKLTISCGAPNPGFTGENTVALVTFSTKTLGETSLTLTRDTQILLNDGKGTNIFGNPFRHNLIIFNSI